MDGLLHQYDRLQKRLDLVQTLHERQVKDVPSRYILPSDQRPQPALHARHTIPVIDLAAPAIQIVSQLAQASTEWGFFQVVNHGIPLSLLERVTQVSKEFFELSVEEKKRQCPMRPGTFMLEGYGRSFDVSDETVLDWVDCLFHYLSPPYAKAVEHWPKTPTTYRETYEEYAEEVKRLSDKLLGMLSEGLGLQAEYLKNVTKELMKQVAINYYPPCPQPDLVIGRRPHSDGGVLTVLLDDQVEGLQVRKGDEWFNVARDPQALVINIGDMLQIISNGKYKSAEHRAVASLNQYRMSMVVFLFPEAGVIIGPADELIDEDHPKLYESTQSDKYATSYMSNDIRGKAQLESLQN